MKFERLRNSFLIATNVLSLVLSSTAVAVMAPSPEWTLHGLSNTHIVYKDSSTISCLQNAVNDISSKTKGGEASPTLVREVFKTAKAYGLDPVIFLGLIYQESGDFKPKDGVNGTGVAQMTGIAIRDTCFNLEGTSCPQAKANPNYLEVWEEKSNAALQALFGRHYDANNPKGLYPWRLYCSSLSAKPELNFSEATKCNSMCGITSACIRKIDQAMMEDNRINLHLAGMILLNYLGVANKRLPKASMKEKYTRALTGYNGHPKHKHNYASNVFKKVAILKKYCEFD